MKLKYIPLFCSALFLVITSIAIWGVIKSDTQFDDAIKKYNYSFKILVSTSFMERNNGNSSSRIDKKTYLLFPKLTSIVVKKNTYNNEITVATEESKIYAYIVMFFYTVCFIFFIRSIFLFLNKRTDEHH